MPCKIQQANHTIDFKKINLANLKNEQSPQWEAFSIDLIDCPSYIDKATLQISGTPDNNNSQYFFNSGTAKNVALELKDDKNNDKIAGCKKC